MWQKIRFLTARWNGKKIPIYMIVVAFVLWLIIPTGDPTDLLTIFFIKKIGISLSLVITLILLLIFLGNRKIRAMLKSPTRNETEMICHKISKTKLNYKDCLKENG